MTKIMSVWMPNSKKERNHKNRIAAVFASFAAVEDGLESLGFHINYDEIIYLNPITTPNLTQENAEMIKEAMRMTGDEMAVSDFGKMFEALLKSFDNHAAKNCDVTYRTKINDKDCDYKSFTANIADVKCFIDNKYEPRFVPNASGIVIIEPQEMTHKHIDFMVKGLNKHELIAIVNNNDDEIYAIVNFRGNLTKIDNSGAQSTFCENFEISVPVDENAKFTYEGPLTMLAIFIPTEHLM